jgi:hypothetical protein
MDQEYLEFVVKDTLPMLAQALAVYLGALAAYWIFIG